jgi:enoyl-CoA hydratase/carnithine racemase
VPRFVTDLLARLAAQLELELDADGTPRNPLVVLELDRWSEAPPEVVARGAGMVTEALPVTVGVLSGPCPPSLHPLAAALSLTITDEDVSGGTPAQRALVPTADIPGRPGLDEAIARLRTAAGRSPRAAIACGQLLRQTPSLGTTAGLAAEAAAYSTLLAGPEFGRWLAARGTRPRRTPPAEPVRISRAGGRLSVVLADPDRRNAFSTPLREALLEGLLLAEADDSICLVELSGAGPAFCSGGDLNEFGHATDLASAYLVRLSRAPWRVIERIAPKVTVLAHGACVGAGTEMLAYAGHVIATPDAFFQLPEVGMGLIPGAGGSVGVPRRTGRHRAGWLMLSGDRLPARTALRWGLVDEVAG